MVPFVRNSQVCDAPWYLEDVNGMKILSDDIGRLTNPILGIEMRIASGQFENHHMLATNTAHERYQAVLHYI